MWRGQRVELNALTSEQLITWLEAKLAEAGVTRYAPPDVTLETAYRRACLIARITEQVSALLENLDDATPDIPENLAQHVMERLKDNGQSWDSVIFDLAQEATRQ
jgi:hypothetical protein